MLVLLVDDSRSSLLKLKLVVEEFAGVETLSFIDPEAALEAMRDRRLDLAIVDHVMPKIDGITLIRRMRAVKRYAEMPIVMFTSTIDSAVRLEALEAGATDFLNKTSDPIELRIKIRNLLKLSDAMSKLDDKIAWLAHEVKKATRSLLEREEEMIFRLSRAVEYRDSDTGDHTLRVATYSKLIAEELGLSNEECRRIYLASPLHDVGKVAVPDNLLLRPGPLDTEEMAIVRTHAEVGERILGDSTSDLMRLAAEIAGSHHERWDGTGYPRGCSGASIPLCARIVAVADVFDALTTARPYKGAMPIEAALASLQQQRGRHFDPLCVNAFVTAFRRRQAADLSASREGKQDAVYATVG